jgi:hypothetical protein
MPSQITHYLFAKDVVGRSFGAKGERLLQRFGNLIAWSAQGPDIFYHNQRTRPSSFKYGRILHRGGYGTLIYHLLRSCVSAPDEKCEAFLYSFVTHAVLDRYLHPFIIYFSGWREPGDKKSYELYRMHAFFERILDLLLCGKPDFDFYSRIEGIDNHFEFLRETLIDGIRKTYTKLNKPDLDEISFSSAWKDAIFFYNVTNCADRENIRYAYERDKSRGFAGKLLAVYYPKHYDKSIDYLNENHAAWEDPFYPGRKSEKSFYDLYGEARDAACSAVGRLEEIIGRGDDASAERGEVEEIVGNGNLSNGELKKDLSPKIAAPLPLYEQLAREYCGVEQEFGLEKVFKYKQPVKGAVNCL